MRVVALAGGVGAGKFLRGLVRVVDARDVTVIVNTADDLELHGLHVSPDIDSVTYWLAGVADRERGWGRAGETFRATAEIDRLGGDAWFGLGDLDLATHLVRTASMRAGATLTEATGRIAAGFGIEATILPMTEDTVTTRVEVLADGRSLDLHFQEYWVRRGGRDEVKAVRYAGAAEAEPAPGAVEAVAAADAVVICPSNPVASVLPILSIAGLREAVTGRRDHVVAVTPIVRGAPLRGMADRLMPAAGLEVSARGTAAAYRGVCGAFIVDERDPADLERIRRSLDMRAAAVDTLMVDDDAAERLARAALALAAG